VAATLALSATATAYADTAADVEAGTLSEVVVTAERRDESVMKVPLAVTAYSAADMASLNLTNSFELSGLAPTLQVNSAFGTAQPNFSIRGIGVSNEHNPNQASPIGVYFDDAYISARVSQGLQIFDLDQIEVLRGPQGTLFGRNTTGGAINFISRQPTLTDATNGTGNVEVGYASYDTFTAEGAYETTFKEDVAGLRVAFNYAHGNGWDKNIYPSQPDANSTDNAAARLIYRMKPTDALDITVKIDGGTSDPTQAGVFNLGEGAPGEPADYNTVLQTSRTAQGLSFWEIDSNRLGYNKAQNFGSEFTLKYRINEQWSVYWLTSYDFANAQFTQEGTGVNSPVIEQPLDTLYGNKFSMINQELRASYSTDKTHFQGGLYYGYDKDDSDSYYWLFDGLENIHQVFNQYRDSYAAFAQLDQSLTDHLSATLGARYTRDYNTYANYYSYIQPASLSQTGERDTSPQLWAPTAGSVFFLGSSYDAATGKILSGPAYKLDSDAPTWRGALNYTFDNGEIVYVSYNRGYRGAAFCGQCFANTTLNTTRPETDDAYEVGTKGTFFNHRLQIAFDGFWINYRNQQTNEEIGVQSELVNVPKSQMKGLELEATAAPTQDLRVVLSAGYDDAKIEQLTLVDATVTNSQEPYAPKITANLRLDWKFASVGDGTFTLTPSLVYTSYVFYSPYDNVAGNGPLSQPAYVKLNAQLAYETSKYSVRFWGKNLTDKQTFEDGLDLRAFGYYYLVPAAPRTFGLTFGLKF
jgi:iron complex outermembrane receptor protein